MPATDAGLTGLCGRSHRSSNAATTLQTVAVFPCRPQPLTVMPARVGSPFLRVFALSRRSMSRDTFCAMGVCGSGRLTLVICW